MLNFEGKVIKIYLNATSGFVVQTGPFIGFEDDFLLMKNPITNEVNYISKYYIKTIEVVRDIDERDRDCLE